MGQEVSGDNYSDEAFAEFNRRVAAETATLAEWIADGEMQSGAVQAGFELEAWLVDRKGQPAPRNLEFLQLLQHHLVVPELAKFNVEFNSKPRQLGPGVFEALYQELSATWGLGGHIAEQIDSHLMMVGILPTVMQADLGMHNMSDQRRYRALNEQIFRLRDGEPIRLAIEGHDHLSTQHPDVMLESAATSFQIHWRVDPSLAVRAFNACKIASAPMVGLSANSPFLFHRDLWQETRIPLFEQAVCISQNEQNKRVGFGVRYAQDSIMEAFEANRDNYDALLPEDLGDADEPLPHLRLHNGTIWRWNRPLVGFDADNKPHLRMEHRVAAAGPTPLDLIANAAFFYGLGTWLIEQPTAPEHKLPFEDARRNFYAAARNGLHARVHWLDGASGSLRDLVLRQLLPNAAEGLRHHGLPDIEIERWLGIVRERVESGQTGAEWQRRWMQANGHDYTALVLRYLSLQDQEMPVHTWPLD